MKRIPLSSTNTMQTHSMSNKIHPSWTMLDALKSKLSPSWVRCLETLANSHAIGLSIPQIMEDTKDSTGSTTNKANTWEQVLNVLVTDDIVIENNELKLLPFFVQFPIILQTRFLFFMSYNIPKISGHAVRTFVGKIDQCHHNNLWMTNVLRWLDSLLGIEDSSNHEICVQKRLKYEFSTTSQDILKNILHDLKTKTTASNQIKGKFNPANFSLLVNHDKMISPIKPVTTPVEYGQQQNQHSFVDVDVITISDDNSEDHSDTYVKKVCAGTSSEDFRKDRIFKVGEICQDHVPVMTGNKQKVTAVQTNCVTSSKNASAFDQLVPSDLGLTFEMPSKKRMRTLDDSKTTVEVDESDRKHLKLDDTNVSIVWEIDENVTRENVKNLDQPSCTTVNCISDLPEDVKNALSSLREACCREEQETVITTNSLSCLLHLDDSQMKSTCAFLNLLNFSEKALVNMCDNVPWSGLGYEATFILLNSCFSAKLTDMQAPASHTLLTGVKSVAKVQPKVVVDVFVQILHSTQSGEYQCQMLASVCKDSLPQDYFGYLIKQLSTTSLVMNENLAVVIEILLNKQSDLDRDVVTSLLSLLTRGSQEMASSLKFGKLLLGLITKFGKKMIGGHLAAVGSLVDLHNSRLKKSLQSALKRVT